MAIKTIRVFAEYTSDGYVPMPSQGNIDYGVTLGSTFPETEPSSFQTDDPNIDVAVTTMTDFYVWIRTHGSSWNPSYTRVVRVYPDSPSVNSVVMNMIVAVGGGGTSINAGGGVTYYLNGGTSQGVLDGSTYYEMSKTPVEGAMVDFFKINTTNFENIAQFVTDAGDPSLLKIPPGAWPLGFYFSASDNSGNPKFYAEIYKYSAAGVFTLLGSSVASPEVISNGVAIDYYTTTVTIPETTLLITDRIAIRIFVDTDGNRTVNFHTQDAHLATVGTTFANGLTAINGLTKQVQFINIGTAGSDAAIVSSDDTHTINLPTASATKRGLLNSTDWSTFNAKQAALSGTGFVKIDGSTISYDNSSYQPLDGDLTAIGALAGTTGILKKTGANTWALDTNSYQLLDADLTAIAALSGTSGILKKTAADTWELDTSTYLTTSVAADTYQRKDKMVSNLLASDTEYPNSNAVLAKLALKANAENPEFTGYMTVGGAYPKIYLTDSDNNPDYFIGNDDGYFRIYDQTNTVSRFYITSLGVSTFPGSVIVGSVAKSGGLSTEFLKADGTVDSNTYVTSGSLSNYLLSATAASTYQRLDKMVSNLLASDTEYPNSNAVLAKLALKADAASPTFTGNMTISSASPKLYLTDTDNNPDYFIGNDDGYFRIYDQTAGASRFYITSLGVSTFPGDVIVGSIAKSGGTASQFLKADGSVDSNTYVSSTSLASYLLITDAVSTYQRKDKMVSNLLASDTEYPNSNAVLAKLALKADAANPTYTGNVTISGAEPKIYFTDTDQNPDYFIGVDAGYFRIYNQTAGQTKFVINSDGDTTITNSLIAGSIIKSGGTSSQFLKADGSVDSSTYLTSYSETDTLASVVSRGASTSNKGIAIVANSSQGALYADQLTFANNTSGDFIQIGFQQQDSDGMHHRGYIKSYKSTAGNYAGIVEIVARSVNGGTVSDVLKLEAGQAPKWGGNIMLHATNYSNYALPITGGTLSGNRPIQFDTGGGAIIATGNTGGWSMGTYYKGSDNVIKGGFGAYGGGSSFNWVWIGTGYDNTWAQVNASAFNTQVALQQNGNQVLHASNYGSYALPLSGGTVTGLSIFNGKITLGSSSSGTWNGNKVGLTLNSTAEIRSLQTQDPPALTWHYEGLATRHILMTSSGVLNVVSPSTENGGVAILAVNGNTVLHAGNYSSYALPTSGGTLTGALNVRTGINLIKSDGSTQGGQLQFDSNINQLYLWNSVTGGYFSIYTNGGERLQIAANGNTTISQGLSIGSELSVGPNSGSDNGIRVNYGNYSSGYGRIRFYQDNSNHSTIHSFSNNWQGGTLQGHSSGAINLAGSYGVTIGDWNNVDMWIDKGGNAQARTSMRAPIFYDSNDLGYYGNFASTSRVNGIYADYIGIGQDINTGYRLITNGSIYLNSNGNGFAEGTWKQRRGGSTFYDVIDTASIGSQSVNYASYSGYSQGDFLHSGRDFPSGTLIQTNINYAVTYGDPWVLEIRGFGYNGAAPFDIQLAGYIYYDTIINQGGYSNGTNISGLRAINYNGNLCFWFPYQGYWQGYNVKAYVPYEGRQTNRVTSISNTGQPTTAKQVDFTLHQSLRTDNAPYAWNMNQYVRTSDNVNFNKVNATNGGTVSIGDINTTYTYSSDSVRSKFYATSNYPVLTLNSEITTSNANHGPTIQLTVSGYDSNRHWVVGTGGTGQFLDFGTSQQSNRNPHGGIAGYYEGTGGTYMRITKNGKLGIGYNWGDGNYGGTGDPLARIHILDNVGTSFHGASGIFRATQSANGNHTPFLFQSDMGNHSWGIITRFYISQAGADRPSIQFAYGGSDTRWSVGYCYPDDNFRITQNQGFRNDGGTIDNGGWGYERLRISTDGAAQFFNTLTATGFFESSDSRLKELLEDDVQVKNIKNLKAKLYIKNGKQEYGYFAQEAREYMPSAVTVNDKGYLNLSYREVHTAKIARLEMEVEELKKQLNLT